MLLLIFKFYTVAITSYLGFRVSSTGFTNVFIKYSLLGIAGVGIFLILQHFGYVIRIPTSGE